MANRLELILAASTTQLEAGMQRATDAVEGLSDEAKGLKTTLGDAGDALEDVASTSRLQGLEQAGQFISNVAGQVGQLAGQFLEAGKQLDDLKDRIGTFTDAGKVDEVASAIRNVAAETGQADAALVAAAQKMGTFGQYSEDNLRRVVDMAAKTGKSLEQATQAFVLLGAGGPAASEAINQLAKDFGISADEMAAAGAVVDKNNKILADTPANAAAAQKALQAIIDSDFAGAAAEQQGSLDELHTRIEQMNQDIGEHTLQAYEAAADAMLPFLDILKDMPGWMKQVVGVGTGVVGTLGGIAGTGLQAAANISLLASNSAFAAGALAKAGAIGRAAFTAILGPLGLAIIAIGALAAGIQAYIDELDRANAAAEELLATEERRAAALRKHADYIGKSANELHRMGVKSSELVDVIGALQDQAEAADKAGNKEQFNKLVEQIRQARLAKVGLAELEAAEKAAKAARDERIKTPAAPAADLKGLEDLKKATDAATKSTVDLGAARTQTASTPAAPPAAASAPKRQEEASKKQVESAEKSAKVLERGVAMQNQASEKQEQSAERAAQATERAAAATERAADKSADTFGKANLSVQDFVQSQADFFSDKDKMMKDPADVGSDLQSRVEAVGSAVQAAADANTGVRSAMGGGADLSAAAADLKAAAADLKAAAAALRSSGGGKSSSSGSGVDWGYFSSGSTP